MLAYSIYTLAQFGQSVGIGGEQVASSNSSDCCARFAGHFHSFPLLHIGKTGARLPAAIVRFVPNTSLWNSPLELVRRVFGKGAQSTAN